MSLDVLGLTPKGPAMIFMKIAIKIASFESKVKILKTN